MSDAKTTKAAAKAATTKAAPVAKPAEAAPVEQKSAETVQTTEAADAPVAIADGEQQKTDAAQADQAKEAMKVATEQAASQKPLPPGDDGSVKPQAGPADPVEPLADFIARVEREKLGQDVVAVAITHPEVMQERVHPGTYGGIRLSNGPVGVVYSDGTKA
jgi:hypothetical protein